MLFLAFGMAMGLRFSVIVGGLPTIADGREPRFLSDTTARTGPHLTFNDSAAEIVRYAWALLSGRK